MKLKSRNHENTFSDHKKFDRIQYYFSTESQYGYINKAQTKHVTCFQLSFNDVSNKEIQLHCHTITVLLEERSLFAAVAARFKIFNRVHSMQLRFSPHFWTNQGYSLFFSNSFFQYTKVTHFSENTLFWPKKRTLNFLNIADNFLLNRIRIVFYSIDQN